MYMLQRLAGRVCVSLLPSAKPQLLLFMVMVSVYNRIITVNLVRCSEVPLYDGIVGRIGYFEQAVKCTANGC